MTYWMEDVNELPEPKSARASKARPLIEALIRSQTGMIRLLDDDIVALDRIYKTLIQWRARHKELGIGIRKVGTEIYLWRPDYTGEVATAPVPPSACFPVPELF